jgi:hypothetical protein
MMAKLTGIFANIFGSEMSGLFSDRYVVGGHQPAGGFVETRLNGETFSGLAAAAGLQFTAVRSIETASNLRMSTDGTLTVDLSGSNLGSDGFVSGDSLVSGDLLGGGGSNTAEGLTLIFGGTPYGGELSLTNGGSAFALSGNGQLIDLGKLQWGLAEIYLESQAAISGLSATDGQTALASFDSENDLAAVSQGYVAIDAIAADGDGAALPRSARLPVAIFRSIRSTNSRPSTP